VFVRGRRGRDFIYGCWIYNYLYSQCLSPLTLWVPIPLRGGVLDTTLCDKVSQWLPSGRWFSPISTTNKTDRRVITYLIKIISPHLLIFYRLFCNITDVLLKVALNTIKPYPVAIKTSGRFVAGIRCTPFTSGVLFYLFVYGTVYARCTTSYTVLNWAAYCGSRWLKRWYFFFRVTISNPSLGMASSVPLQQIIVSAIALSFL